MQTEYLTLPHSVFNLKDMLQTSAWLFLQQHSPQCVTIDLSLLYVSIYWSKVHVSLKTQMERERVRQMGRW